MTMDQTLDPDLTRISGMFAEMAQVRHDAVWASDLPLSVEQEPATTQGLTPEEFAVLEHLTDAVNAFAALPDHHPSALGEFVFHVHVLQRQVMARMAARAYPGYFGLPEGRKP